jgi:hypothetical protein
MTMCTIPFPGPYPTTMAHILLHHIQGQPSADAAGSAARRDGRGSHLLRRRPTKPRGRALEILGHAIEYLVDQQLHSASESESESETGPPKFPSHPDATAIQILMRLSREVFAQCTEAASTGPSVRQRLLRLFPTANAE